ncbi:MAG: hypothetical protein ACFFFH_17225 [Candidatus Thorarchaeota archaeon]
MKIWKIYLLIGLILVFYSPNSTLAYNHKVDIFQVTKIGSSVSIVLDYDLNSTVKQDSNESLAVLVVFSQDEPFLIEAAMLFLHTEEDQNFLFWMLGNPYTQAQNWVMGRENEHFQTQNELLTLNFIEYLDIGNPEIHPLVNALITSGEVNNQTNDLSPILDQFVSYLPVYYEFPSIQQPDTTEETSTGEETTQETSVKKSSQTSVGGLTPGFTILSTVSILLSTLVVLRIKRKQ